MSPSRSCFSLETDSTTSPSSTVELLQSGFFRVEETTNLGIELNLSAKPASSFIEGQAAAKPS